jgi:hypothetical protein
VTVTLSLTSGLTLTLTLTPHLTLSQRRSGLPKRPGRTRLAPWARLPLRPGRAQRVGALTTQGVGALTAQGGRQTAQGGKTLSAQGATGGSAHERYQRALLPNASR